MTEINLKHTSQLVRNVVYGSWVPVTAQSQTHTIGTGRPPFRLSSASVIKFTNMQLSQPS
jgi:hypothetical protein